jgi:hypothetical protein
LFHSFGIMLENGKAVIMDIERAIGDLSHETYTIIPLPFVFNKFNVLRKCNYSIEAGYEKNYVLFEFQCILKLKLIIGKRN